MVEKLTIAESRAEPEALLRPPEVARLLGVQTSTLDAWRLKGRGPAFVRVSRRCVRYRPLDLRRWAESRLANQG